jgi:mono/diheme cytochrome c family protein
MARRTIRSATAEAALVLAAVGLAFAAGFAGWVVGHATRSAPAATPSAAATPAAAVDPHVAAGAHDFVNFACAQCHGERGRGGVSPDVPALTNVAQSLTPARLTPIIDHGLGESANPTKPTCRCGVRSSPRGRCRT